MHLLRGDHEAVTLVEASSRVIASCRQRERTSANRLDNLREKRRADSSAATRRMRLELDQLRAVRHRDLYELARPPPRGQADRSRRSPTGNGGASAFPHRHPALGAPREADNIAVIIGDDKPVQSRAVPHRSGEPTRSLDRWHERNLLDAGLSEHHLDHPIEVVLRRRPELHTSTVMTRRPTRRREEAPICCVSRHS